MLSRRRCCFKNGLNNSEKSRRRLEGIRLDWMRNQSYKSHLGYVGMSAQTEDDASVCNAIVVLSDIRMIIELKCTSIK